MSFVRHIEVRFARALAILGLPEAAAHVMQALVVVDLEGPSKTDVHGRQGILTWQHLVEQLEAQF